MSDFNKLTPVQEFYKGKTIFITGGSGFMGKVSANRFREKRKTCTNIIICSIAGTDREIVVLMLRIERNFNFGSTEERKITGIAYRRYVQIAGKFETIALS